MRYEVHIRSSFADPAPVLAALDGWHAATGVVFEVAMSEDACVPGRGPCFRIGSYSLDEIVRESRTAGCMGYTNEPGGMGYTSDVMVGPEYVAHVAMHEIGHALGLAHVADEASVMFLKTGAAHDSLTLTSTDVAEFWSVRQ